MNWLRRALVAVALAGLLAGVCVLAQPSPPPARAGIGCEIATAPAHAITGGLGALSGGAIGGGNPIGDACDKVSGAITGAITAPITSALKGVGNDIFAQLTSWVSEGAGWLIGQVVVTIEHTTTPQLATEGFLSQYAKMAAIAALLAAAMLLAAVLEGLAQGNATLLLRVALINAPLALLATSVAYAVVQLLLVATDGLCAAISASSHHGAQHFFEAAITDLGHAGGEAGAKLGSASEGAGTSSLGASSGRIAGTGAVPLFVAFLAAIVGAFAAFFVWLELLMRDAAVYVVALFMPLGLAASIWPRWSGTLRRTAELLVAVIGSKFVIVAIVALAAALVAGGGGGVEHVLAASALMLLACFAPFVLLRLVPFAEGAMGAAYGRRSAAGGTVSAVQMGSDTQILRNMADSQHGSGVALWGAEGGGGGPKPPGPGGGGLGGGGSSGGGGAGGGKAAAGGGAAGAGPAAAAAIPAAAGRGARSAAERLQQTGTAQQAGETSPQAGAAEAGGSPSLGERPPRPSPEPPAPEPGRGEAE